LRASPLGDAEDEQPKLMTPMTARGMFSRHRNNSSSHQSDTLTPKKSLEPVFWFNLSCK
jgi:hypothetical protein